MSRKEVLVSQGDIILVLYPFTNFRRGKPRPALVISADWYNRSRSDVITLPLTSRIPSQFERDTYELKPKDLNFARLNIPSVVKLGVIMTVNNNLIIKKIGKLPLGTVKDIIHRISYDILATR